MFLTAAEARAWSLATVMVDCRCCGFGFERSVMFTDSECPDCQAQAWADAVAYEARG